MAFICIIYLSSAYFTAEVSAQEEKVGSRRSSKGCLQYRSEVEHLLLAPLAKQFESENNLQIKIVITTQQIVKKVDKMRKQEENRS